MLGCGGLDFMVVLFVEVFDVELCEIWIDVIGVYIIDLCIILVVYLLFEFSFEEVVEMVIFGVKVLYFVIMEFVFCKDIKVFVGFSKELEKGGIWIVCDCEYELLYCVIICCKE